MCVVLFVEYDMYKETCAVLHMLDDDKEWYNVISAALRTKLPVAVRKLFVPILNEGYVEVVGAFSAEFHSDLMEDFVDSERLRIHGSTGTCVCRVCSEQHNACVLIDRVWTPPVGFME